MGVTFAVHPFAGARLAQELDRPGFKHAGANAGEDMRLCLPFEDDAVDVMLMQQMGEQHAGRPRRR